MNAKDRRFHILVVTTTLAWSVLGCGGGAPDQEQEATTSTQEVARTYAAAMNHCFASEPSARVINVDRGATLALGGACSSLPVIEGRENPSTFAVEHADLLVDPSMTGAEFVLTSVKTCVHCSAPIEVTLRYFRSNGAPYDFTATLGRTSSSRRESP